MTCRELEPVGFDFPALDVAIGLLFLYLVIALVCSTVNEAISTAFGMRARFLQLGLAGWDEVEREARSPRHLFLVATHEELDDLARWAYAEVTGSPYTDPELADDPFEQAAPGGVR